MEFTCHCDSLYVSCLCLLLECRALTASHTHTHARTHIHTHTHIQQACNSVVLSSLSLVTEVVSVVSLITIG